MGEFRRLVMPPLADTDDSEEGVKGFMYGIVRDTGWARMPDGVGGGIIIIIIIRRRRSRCRRRNNAYLGGCSLDSPPTPALRICYTVANDVSVVGILQHEQN